MINRTDVEATLDPFLNGLKGAIFQQDNARRHTARVAQDFLRDFQTLPWPAAPSDLSPVEHVGSAKTVDAIVLLLCMI
ncbi:DDE_3 domain-containing protein [Trichonephila clavipes]|nr:DDE_3 domain-containing protein [Trichonephila clavipes]